MGKKRVVFVILAAILALLMFGCHKQPKPVAIEIPAGTFKSVYDIDEELDIEGKNIFVLYDDDSRREIPLEADMIEGFYSENTGTRAGLVKYLDFTTTFVYTVECSDDPDLEVLTEARLKLSAEAVEGGKAYTVNFNVGDMSSALRGIYFTVFFTNPIADAIFSNLEWETIEGWGEITYFLKEDSVRFVLFADGSEEGISSDGQLFRLKIKAESDVYISDVVISDGISDYNLPSTEVL